MKKILCILFAVLFAFSAMNLTAFAAETEERIAEDAYTKASLKTYNNTIYLEIDKDESYTLRYDALAGKDNVPVPKGGSVKWAAVYAGGFVKGSVSKDKKSCTITGTDKGNCVVAAWVYDANGNELSLDSIVVLVRYTGLFGAIDNFFNHNLSRAIFNFFRMFTGMLPSVVFN